MTWAGITYFPHGVLKLVAVIEYTNNGTTPFFKEVATVAVPLSLPMIFFCVVAIRHMIKKTNLRTEGLPELWLRRFTV